MAYEGYGGDWAGQFAYMADPGYSAAMEAAYSAPATTPSATTTPTPTTTEPTQTGCPSGTTSGVGLNKFTCINGVWTSTPEYEPEAWQTGTFAPEPGFPVPTGPYGAVPLEATAPMSIPGAYGPFTQYLKRVGLGAGNYWNPAQRYLAGLYEPLRGLFEMQQPLGAALGQRTPYWGDFMSKYLGQPRNVWQQYANLLGGLFGMTPESRGEWGFSFEPQYGEFGEQSYEGMPLSFLQNLVTGGLTPSLGRIGAGWLAQRLPYMQTQWELAGPEQTFLDYIRSKYNLGQWL